MMTLHFISFVILLEIKIDASKYLPFRNKIQNLFFLCSEFIKRCLVAC